MKIKLLHPQSLGVLSIFFFIGLLSSCSTDSENLKVVYKWDTLVLDFEGPQVDEADEYNPFLNYSLDVTFSNGSSTYQVPGYFAADGFASESSATSGNVWRVKFTPDQVGEWTYQVSFKKGEGIALAKDKVAGLSLDGDGITGKFVVEEGIFDTKDFRSQGRLQRVGDIPYQQFAESKKYFIKGGANSPENLLAFKDFDGTYGYDSTKQFVKTYSAHLKDWSDGDPTWQDGKGKGLIGSLNYLSKKGMNAIYFLTMNIEGDGRDVWMYTTHEDFTRFDCSKLDQWEIVFSHAQELGIVLQMVTQETENELLFDNGDLGPTRQLYYRELIARFAHHLGLVWNMGEENGPADFSPVGQNDAQRKAMFKYFKENDPYQNFVTIHTHAASTYKDTVLTPILGDKNLDGFSMQMDHNNETFDQFNKWKKLAKDAGHPLVFYFDEIGPYWKGAMPDSYDMAHDTIRREALWGGLMAGSAGTEWYFGYKYPHADLSSEDWRLRDNLWTQTKYAIDFFQNFIPFWEMESKPGIVKNAEGYCLAKTGAVYAVYLPFGNDNAILEAKELVGEKVKISWFNPREGGKLLAPKEITAAAETNLGTPPQKDGMDWVALVDAR